MDLPTARARYGRVIVVELDEEEHLFRPLTTGEARDLTDNIKSAPEISFDLCIEACRTAYLGTTAAFDAVSDKYPGAFAELLPAELLKDAGSAHRQLVRASLSSWKAAERNLVHTAKNLLAFKAYTHGEPSKEALAGALHIADWLDNTKGLFKIAYAYVKAMSRARG